MGCSHFLTQEPILKQSNELVTASYKGLNSAVLGAYSRLADASWYGANYVLDAEMRSGNGKLAFINGYGSGRSATSYNFAYTPNTTSGVWGLGYYIIGAANTVLLNLDGKEDNNVTKQDLDNLKAEALFLRALSHFDIVRLFAQPYSKDPNGAGVPIVLSAESGALIARSTVSEVYTQIIEDLKNAETLMEDDYSRADDVTDPYAAVSKPAVQALLSRVYLNMQKWQECADYSTKVINNTNYKMWTAAEYKKVWGADVPSKGEVIFEIYGIKANEYDGYWDGPSHMTNPDGYGDVAVSKDLVSLYAAGDVRNDFRAVDDADLVWTKKYVGKGKGDAKNTPDVNNVIVLRLSEMYLNRAEAIANGATVAGASVLSDLNVITSNRNAKAYTTATKDDIFTERRKELAFEGQFWFDSARCGKSITRVDYVGDAKVQNISYPNYMFVLPIPQREIDVNPSLVQNEGYN
ncbi:MAG: RagB/SusD family nutrient uptake outer membrane protein [Bacteroidales bacterium]